MLNELHEQKLVLFLILYIFDEHAIANIGHRSYLLAI